MTTAKMTDISFPPHKTKPQTSQSQLEEFDEWFSRCRNTLEYTAFLILADSRKAESAVQRCWFKASRNPPGFESEGAFRSWILRRVISEALHILHQRQAEACGRKPIVLARARSSSTRNR
jgi:DNA-directed RNA polymerase specialized sigma24 family protein